MNISLRIDDELKARLEKAASELDCSVSRLAIEGIRQQVDYHEAFVRAVDEAIAAADGGGPFVSQADVESKSAARWKARRS